MSGDTQNTLTVNGEVYELLSEKQLLAVGWLVQGLSDGDVAEKVGVTRETVNRWRNGDDAFKVALNAARLDVWLDAHNKLRAVVCDAVTVLEGSLRCEAPDVKVALAVLRLAGVKDIGRPDGAVTLEELENERRRDEMMRLLSSVA